jgi:lipopolysaccharide transport system ATP-binding protein
MSSVAIKVENLSKQYRLGQVGTGTLRHDLNRFWHSVRGKEDPYLKIGQSNDRTKKSSSGFVWALKDIDFEVKQGEVMGIVGRNGAGKSTLLKILSKITTPTVGEVKVNGRIASLLEVGTGFHPELTGRENVYMNGAILGMRKWEIDKKFDEILDFAGVEAYIDTPVKRYSSGMKVRLGFAVAAYLEPEILIVDEVLAVGDSEFQKKCIGRMQDVSRNDGRTVLFVSHNMAAIKNLCTRGVLLHNGQMELNGSISEVISRYLEQGKIDDAVRDLSLMPRSRGTKTVLFKNFQIENEKGLPTDKLLSGETVKFCFDLKVQSQLKGKIDVGFSLHADSEEIVTYMYTSFTNSEIVSATGDVSTSFEIPNFPFSQGRYFVKGRIVENNEEADWPDFYLGSFYVESGDFYGSGKNIQPIAPFLISGTWK